MQQPGSQYQFVLYFYIEMDGVRFHQELFGSSPPHLSVWSFFLSFFLSFIRPALRRFQPSIIVHTSVSLMRGRSLHSRLLATGFHFLRRQVVEDPDLIIEFLRGKNIIDIFGKSNAEV